MFRAILYSQWKWSRLIVVLGTVVYEYHLRTLFGTEEEKRAGELRGLIERMGEINLTAIEESEELQKRFDFLTTQKEDLESAISQLETAIERINRASRKRFREVFDAVVGLNLRTPITE